MTIPVLIAAILLSSGTRASMSCTNAGLAEVQCTATDCAIQTAAENVTPISLWLTATGVVSCAYSGCFTPVAGELLSEHDHLVWSGTVARDADPDDRQKLTLLIDQADGVGLLRWGSFATALRCSIGSRI